MGREHWAALFALLCGVSCHRGATSSGSAPHPSSSAPSALAPALALAKAPPDVATPPADAVLTPNGVAMKRLQAGSGTAHPAPNDCVKLNYTAWRRDGTLHSSSQIQGAPATQCLQATMPGLVEALELMVKGERDRIWIPGKLTYRPSEPGEKVPNDDLTLDVELFDLLQAPLTPTDLKKPPREAKKTVSGLVIQVLRAGSGTVHPQSGNRMTLVFSGWASDGSLFESTVMSGQPATVTHADVVEGLREGLSTLVVGEKARFWIPSDLAFGDKPKRGAPAGALVYDVELLAIQ